VITPAWANSLSAVGEHIPALLGFIVCTYVVLIGIAAIVGSLHPDEKRRADAHKVLERLLGHGRWRTRR
jgi:type IV secretory pathway TraG/TraD family ATPase VirD4